MKTLLFLNPKEALSALRAALAVLLMLPLFGGAIRAQQIIDPSVNAFSSENNALFSTTIDGGGRDQEAAATVNGYNDGALSSQGDAGATFFNVATPYMWATAGVGDTNPFITYDLGGMCNLTTTRIWNYNETASLYIGASNILISTSADGANFTVLTNINVAEAGGTIAEPAQNFATPATGVRFVKLQILTNWDGAIFWNSITGTNQAGPHTSVAGLSQVWFEANPYGPNITSQPIAQTVLSNSTATISITVTASVDTAFTYQWQKNGTNLTNGGNISGANAATLQISSVSRLDQANYDVVVSNSLASVVSEIVPLHVDGTLITPISVTPSSEFNNGTYMRLAINLINGNGMSGPGNFIDTHDNNEDGQIADAWHHAPGDTNPFVDFDLGGYYNVYNTRLWNLNQATSRWNGTRTFRVSGSADNATFTIIGTNILAEAGGTTTEPAQDFSTPASNIRYVKIDVLDGYGGGWNGLSAVRFEGALVSALVPIITNQPVGWTNAVGLTATFTVGSTDGGAPPLTYQWLFNGSNLLNGGNISGVNSSTLTITHVALTNQGGYSVIVSNAVTSSLSATAFLQPIYTLINMSSAGGGILIDPSIYAFSSYYGQTNTGSYSTYMRNVTNLVLNGAVSIYNLAIQNGDPTNEFGLTGPGYSTDVHDNGQDDVWHHAPNLSGTSTPDRNPFVTLDLGANYNLLITRIWNLNQGSDTDPNNSDNANGTKDLRISVSTDGTTFTILGTNTLAEGPGLTSSELAQDIPTPASGIRYVKLEPLDSYGGSFDGLGAVRFVVAGSQPSKLLYAAVQGVAGLHYQVLYNSAPGTTNWQVLGDFKKLPHSPFNVPVLDGLVSTNAPYGFFRALYSPQ